MPMLTFINANARSLGSKVESLFDCFEEKEVDLALFTETWFKNGREQEANLADNAANYGLGAVVRKPYQSSCQRPPIWGGGVALFYKNSKTHLVEFPLVNPEDFKALACIGTVHGIEGKVFVLVCYEPPNLTANRANLMHEYIVDVVNEAKRRFQDCTVVLGGDFK